MRQFVVLDAFIHQLPRIATTYDSPDAIVNLAGSHLLVDSRLGSRESLGVLLEMSEWIADRKGVTISSATLRTEWSEIRGTQLLVATPGSRAVVNAWLETGAVAPELTTAAGAGPGPASPEVPIAPCIDSVSN